MRYLLAYTPDNCLIELAGTNVKLVSTNVHFKTQCRCIYDMCLATISTINQRNYCVIIIHDQRL